MRTPDLILFALLTLTLFAPPASAQVFKCKQSSGLIVYSDKPCEYAPQNTDVRLAKSREESSQVDLPASEQKAAATADASAATKPAAPVGNASTLLRAIGPDQALDRDGKVYKRTAGGYMHASGTFIPGVARGHR
jgi:hypothetical protein